MKDSYIPLWIIVGELAIIIGIYVYAGVKAQQTATQVEAAANANPEIQFLKGLGL